MEERSKRGRQFAENHDMTPEEAVGMLLDRAAMGNNAEEDVPEINQLPKNSPVRIFLKKYRSLVLETGVYVDDECGLAMPIDSSENEMDSPEEHITKLCQEEGLAPPNKK